MALFVEGKEHAAPLPFRWLPAAKHQPTIARRCIHLLPMASCRALHRACGCLSASAEMRSSTSIICVNVLFVEGRKEGVEKETKRRRNASGGPELIEAHLNSVIECKEFCVCDVL